MYSGSARFPRSDPGNEVVSRSSAAPPHPTWSRARAALSYRSSATERIRSIKGCRFSEWCRS